MALYILSAMLYNVYACIWVRAVSAFASRADLNITQDYLTDWSLLRTHAKYPLLRDELLCADHLPVSRIPEKAETTKYLTTSKQLYYFAIVRRHSHGVLHGI